MGLKIGANFPSYSICHLLHQNAGCVITYDILSGWTQEVEHSWYSVNAAQVTLKVHKSGQMTISRNGTDRMTTFSDASSGSKA